MGFPVALVANYLEFDWNTYFIPQHGVVADKKSEKNLANISFLVPNQMNGRCALASV